MNQKSSQRSRIQSKIMLLIDAAQQVGRWRENSEQIVLTNGVFDLVHLGHLSYLADAADLGDRLIVAVNSDRSVRKLKGPTRPVFDEATRAFKLASLQVVDLVVIFDAETPLAAISTILPDTLVKGGDYRASEIVGADVVTGYGGVVTTIPIVPNLSSTNVIDRIRNLN